MGRLSAAEAGGGGLSIHLWPPCLVSLLHAAVRLWQPAWTATDSIALDYLAAAGFVVLASPPAAVQMSAAAYLLASMLLFCP